MNKLFIVLFLVVILTSFTLKEKNIEIEKSNISFLQKDTSQNHPSDKKKQTPLSEGNKSIRSIDSKTITSENKSSTISEKSNIDESIGTHPNEISNSDSSKNSVDKNSIIEASAANSNSTETIHRITNENFNQHNISSYINDFKKTSLFIYLILLVLILGLILVLSLNKRLKGILKVQTDKNSQLLNEIQSLQLAIKNMIANSEKNPIGKNEKIEVNNVDQEKKAQEFLLEVIGKNKLSNTEISALTDQNKKRWISVGHSAIGKMHIKSVPQTPCQDNHFFELLDKAWNLSIVCDGAGSAKYSHYGSEYFAKNSIPKRIKTGLSQSNWYNEEIIPTDKQWKEFIIKVLQDCYSDFKDWYSSLDLKDAIEKDFATTIIISIHNEKSVLVANIGDGRGGFLNDQGEFKPLFIPFKGSESNSTVFITSPIWEKVDEFIQTRVIHDNLISVFILSDGMEKVSFNCSILVQKWIDPNLPYRNFFYPILTKIKNLTEAEEETLSDMWIKFIEEGNDLIKSESDDKTMVISFLK